MINPACNKLAPTSLTMLCTFQVWQLQPEQQMVLHGRQGQRRAQRLRMSKLLQQQQQQQQQRQGQRHAHPLDTKPATAAVKRSQSDTDPTAPITDDGSFQRTNLNTSLQFSYGKQLQHVPSSRLNEMSPSSCAQDPLRAVADSGIQGRKDDCLIHVIVLAPT